MDTSNLSQADILTAALALPEASRRQLAEDILHSLAPAGIWSLDAPGFGEELQQRARALESGEDPGMGCDDLDQMFKVARERIDAARRGRTSA